ncbi:hypothetical protein HY772_05575 [Candidatus Woesearchaeota archaeon]|nr:hypothetical protein [Candidatus Woesearchaeota archaeon]
MSPNQSDKNDRADIDSDLEAFLAEPGWTVVETKKRNPVSDGKFGDRTPEDIRLTFGDEIADAYEAEQADTAEEADTEDDA